MLGNGKHASEGFPFNWTSSSVEVAEVARSAELGL